MIKMKRPLREGRRFRSATLFLLGLPILMALAYASYVFFYVGDQSERERCEAVTRNYGVDLDCTEVDDTPRK